MTSGQRPPITNGYLKSILYYNPETGGFTWIAPRKRIVVGAAAGTALSSNGYRQIRIDQRGYLVHRLAWFYMTGEWPPEVDHKNLDRADNRWVNLRYSDQTLNKANAKKRSHNTSGYKGVIAYRDRWIAAIAKNKKRHHLGIFDTREAAAAAYDERATALFGQFARTNFGEQSA